MGPSGNPDGDASQGALPPPRYRFGDIEVDVAAHTLVRAGQPQTVEPKAFAVLVALLARAGQLVPRDELLDDVWGHRYVTPGVLTRVIAQLRQALGDDSHHPRYIQTQHALGYRFIGALEVEADARAGAGAERGDGYVDEVAAAAAAGPADARPVAAAEDVDATRPRAQTDDARSLDAAMDSAGVHADADPQQHRREPSAAVGRDNRSERRRFPRGRWAWAIPLALALVAGLWWLLDRRDGTPRATEDSIAVLPFTTLSDDRQDRYFAEGLAAEMHGALAGVHGLKVAAWLPPTARIAGEDVKALGKRLGVATVLDASVRRAGPRVRISARLSDTHSGYTLWSETYDRELADVFATQSDIAQQVATSLVGVMPDGGEGLRRRLAPTRNVAAFDAYLRGVSDLASGGEDRKRALGHFSRALQIDKDFARAQAGVCRVELWRFESSRDASAFDTARLACLRAENMDGTMPEVQLALGDLHRAKGDLARADDYYERVENEPSVRAQALVGRARIAAQNKQVAVADALFDKALSASPGDARVYSAIGMQRYFDGRLPEAIQALSRATDLRPGDAYAWATLGGLLLTAGRNEAADEALQRSLAIEPIESVLSNLGTIRYQQADYAAAVGYYRKATELNPENSQIWGNLGDALLADRTSTTEAKDAFKEAAARAQRYVDLKPRDAKALAALGWYRANTGDVAAALDLVRRSEGIGEEPAEVAYYNANTFALLGRRADALRRIEAARRAGIAEQRLATNALFRRNGLVAVVDARK